MTSRTGDGGERLPSAAAPWTGVWYVAAATSRDGAALPCAAAPPAGPPAHTSSMLTLAATPSNISSSISVGTTAAPPLLRLGSIA